MTSFSDRLASATIDARPLAVARVLFALAALAMLRSSSRRITMGPGDDPVQLPWPLIGDSLSGVPPLVIIVVWGVGALLLLVGVRSRVGAGAVVVGMLLFYGADRQHYGNGAYFILLLAILFACIDSDAAGPLWRMRPSSARWWPAFLLCAQVSILYGFAAIQKFRPSALGGDTVAFQLQGPLADVLSFPGLPALLNLSGGVLEVLCAIGLWLPAWRRRAMVGGVLLHLGVLAFIRNSAGLLAFGVASISIYPLYGVVSPQLRSLLSREG